MNIMISYKFVLFFLHIIIKFVMKSAATYTLLISLKIKQNSYALKLITIYIFM